MMTDEGYLEGLNPEQRSAVEHVEGPLLVLAGAGSGKTRVLTTRIARLVGEHGVDPAGVLAVTFTNKAAAEMRERIRRLLGRDPAGMWIGTFHSVGARLLRRHGGRLGWSPSFSIYDSDQSQREIKRTLERLDLSPKRWAPRSVQTAISSAKNQLIGPDEYERMASDLFAETVARVYPAYQRSLLDQNVFDFDDLLVKPVELFEGDAALLAAYRERFRFILVDEYQDTNRAQYRLLELLAREHANIMVVGDDDQSIYRWRGADITNILDFEKHFPAARTVRLERNYRSTARILDVANRVIAENVRRKGKTLRTQAEAGERLTRLEAADERDEADWIASEIEALLTRDPDRRPRDFAILYRTNAQSRALEEALRRRDVPYQIIGGTRFYERREIMDVLAYLRLISNPRDAGAFDRIVNYPRRGIGDQSKARLLSWAAEQGLTPLEATVRAERCQDLTPSARRSLTGFGELIERFAGLAAHADVGDILERLFEEIGLGEALRAEGPEGEDRLDNVRELIAGAHEFVAGDIVVDEEDDVDASSLDLFLQKVSLLTDVDRHDPRSQAVTLMTLHNAKGLEFPVVFVSGLEDGLFPLSRAYDDPDALEEERRLFYVGITRAQRKVYLTHARSRRRAGEFLTCMPSSFMEPIPDELVDERVTPLVQRTQSASDRFLAGSRGSASRGGGGRRPAEAGFGGRSASGGGGLVVDYSDSQDSPRYVKGERVVHPRFGSGVIRELSGFGLELKAVIEFETAGRKKVIVRYANLQKEPG